MSVCDVLCQGAFYCSSVKVDKNLALEMLPILICFAIRNAPLCSIFTTKCSTPSDNQYSILNNVQFQVQTKIIIVCPLAVTSCYRPPSYFCEQSSHLVSRTASQTGFEPLNPQPIPKVSVKQLRKVSDPLLGIQ